MVNKKLGRLTDEEYNMILKRVIDLLANKA